MYIKTAGYSLADLFMVQDNDVHDEDFTRVTLMYILTGKSRIRLSGAGKKYNILN